MAELIKYALKKGTLEIVHVDTVDNGLGCNCMCPYCKKDMEARQGTIRDHSFAHAKGVTDCGQASMTMLHLMAQKIIEEEKRVKLPSFEGFRKCFTKPESDEQFFDVILEKWDDETGKRPDCECTRPTTSADQIPTLWVEIRVSHEVDDNKRREIIKKGVDCVEIDLQQFIGADYSEDDLRQFILNDASKTKWIHAATYIKEDQRIFNELNPPSLFSGQEGFAVHSHTNGQYVDWDPSFSHYAKGLPNFPSSGSLPLEEYYRQVLQCMEIYYQSGFYDSNLAYYKEKKATYERLLGQWLGKLSHTM